MEMPSIRREVENTRLRQGRFPLGTDQEQRSKRETAEAIAFYQSQPAEACTDIGADEDANYRPEFALVWAVKFALGAALIGLGLLTWRFFT